MFSKVKDEDYDAVVQAAVKSSNSFKKALDKIGLDESELKEIKEWLKIRLDTEDLILNAVPADTLAR